MNEAINMLMQSGFFYQMGEQIGETFAKAVKDSLAKPTILPEVGKCYEFDACTDELRVIGVVTAVDYPYVKLRDYGGVINLAQIVYYFEKEISAPKVQP